VDVVYRDGDHEELPLWAGEVSWSHDGFGEDIIAYRILPAEQAKSEDEPAEHISILTGDPAVEPESGLHEKRWKYRVCFDKKESITGHASYDRLEQAQSYFSVLKDNPETLLASVHELYPDGEGGVLWGLIDSYVAGPDADETHTDDLRTAEGEIISGEPWEMSKADAALSDAICSPSITQDPELLAAVERAEATLAAEPAYVGMQDAELDAEFDAMKEREKADRKLHFSIFGERGNRKLEEV
jgi:hypothetical protein